MTKTIRLSLLFILLLSVIGIGFIWKEKHKPKPIELFTPVAPDELVKPVDPPKPEIVESPTPECPKEVKTYAEAVSAAKLHKKDIFLYFGADWCGNCRQMKDQTFSDTEVKKVLENYIVVFIDTDVDRKTTRKYKIYGIPAYFIINADEEKLADRSGFANKQTFLNWLSIKGSETTWSNPQGTTKIKP